jgi:hypothetical protein
MHYEEPFLRTLWRAVPIDMRIAFPLVFAGAFGVLVIATLK